MEPLELAAIAAAVGGRLAAGGGSGPVVGVSTDSRTLRPGQMFVALKGERFDGHDFVAEAVQAGARAVLVRRGAPAALPSVSGCAAIEVDDPLQALQDLAAWYRQRLGVPVAAVTGSVGKTTTKDMVAAILARSRPVVKAPASFNNEVGVPLAILQAGPQARALVLELAMRGPGQIARLAELARPDVGVLTNVGESHLGLLGSREAIARAKGELLEHLRPGGIAVLNASDPLVMAQAPRLPGGCRLLTFALNGPADVRVDKLAGGGLGGTRFRLVTPWGGVDCRLPGPGRHLALNAAAAAGAALALGASLEEVAQALAGFQGASMRMQVMRAGDVVVLNDAYNASPTSMAAALDTLAAVRQERGTGRAVAVLGAMLELGAAAPRLHREVGDRAARAGVDLLVAVGQWAEPMARGAVAAGLAADRVVCLPDAERAAAWLADRVQPHDVVLVKASRAVGLERVARALAGGGGGA